MYRDLFAKHNRIEHINRLRLYAMWNSACQLYQQTQNIRWEFSFSFLRGNSQSVIINQMEKISHSNIRQ